MDTFLLYEQFKQKPCVIFTGYNIQDEVVSETDSKRIFNQFSWTSFFYSRYIHKARILLRNSPQEKVASLFVSLDNKKKCDTLTTNTVNISFSAESGKKKTLYFTAQTKSDCITQ